MSETINNVTCAACGCICENVTVQVDDGRIVTVEGACALCESQLMGRTAEEGESTNSQASIDQAIEILSTARAPLVYGLAQSTVETQRAAVSLADNLGATIDPAIPPFHRAAIVAMQSVGVSTCTLGEAKQRADVVVFWGADPATTHPQLYERFIDSPGKFVQSRHIVGIGAAPGSHRVDDFVQVDSAKSLTSISVLRALMADIEVDESNLRGVPIEPLERLALRLQRASYSAIFFGPEIGGVVELESLFLLVRQLNLQSRSAVMGLGGTQCENVLTWQTGYPCGVNFALGFPRYDPHGYSANSLLERDEVDAVLLVGSEGLGELSSKARSRLSTLPTILLENAASNPLNATVRITTALPGVHCGGTVFRMDGVPLRLSPIFNSPLPTAADILTAIQQGVPAPCA